MCLWARVCSGNLSWPYVNSMSWVVIVGEGAIGVCVWFGAPIRHNMSGRSLVGDCHVGCGHMHLRSPSGIVVSSGLLFRWPTLVSV